MSKKEIVNNSALTVRVNEEPVLDAIENTLDGIDTALTAIESGLGSAVDETVNVIETVGVVTRNNPWVIGGVAVVAGAVGGYVGYRVLKRRVAEHYDELTRREIAKTKENLERKYKVGSFATPEEAAERLGAAVERPAAMETPEALAAESALLEYQGVPVKEVSDSALLGTPPKRREPIVLEADPVIEVSVDSSRPYVITQDEFYNGNRPHDKVSLTYFQGDDTLAEMDDTVLVPDDVERNVGGDNLTKFGKGSDDPNMVYVRNENTGTDYEISREVDSYSHKVLNLTDEAELKHSDRRGGRLRFRDSGE